ncbi:Protein HOTHEAD, partial [Linum grandiflorum]
VTAPYFSFVQEATTGPPVAFYDYIIVGGGAAGCALAATLSQHAAVLVLERGGSPYNNTNITNVANFVSTISDTSPDSPSQTFVSEDGVYNTRARVLGGGSAIGAGFYSRAEANFIRRTGWDQELVRRSYEWVEWKVGFEPEVKQWQTAVREGMVETGIGPYNGFTYAHDYGTKIGGTTFDMMGQRHSAADLLEYARPRNIKVYLHATVTKILFHRVRRWPRPIAYGVVYEDSMGIRRKAILKPHPHNEVILAAGAIGSPQLMMLSGIGPGLHLRSHGIQVVVDQPNVGKGMADNPMNLLYVPSPVPVETSLVQVVGVPYRQNSYIETASGLSFNYSWAQGFARDYLAFFNKTGKPSSLTAETIERAIETVQAYANTSQTTGGVILQKVKGPLSSGDLKLRSTIPHEDPSVSFNYYTSPRDLEGCVEGMRSIVRLINSPSFAKLRYPNLPVQALVDLVLNLPVNLRPRHVSSSISLEQFCKDTVMTMWDYHGGCQVGRVVDPEYRVIGVDGLRVVDGSTLLRSPGTNPQATIMMLGRYMGTRILRERLPLYLRRPPWHIPIPRRD